MKYINGQLFTPYDTNINPLEEYYEKSKRKEPIYPLETTDGVKIKDGRQLNKYLTKRLKGNKDDINI